MYIHLTAILRSVDVGPFQTSKTGFIAKIVNAGKPLTIPTKNSILDI